MEPNAPSSDLSRCAKGRIRTLVTTGSRPCLHSPLNLDKQDPFPPLHGIQVGRLHMWLGKALFLKGGDRRDQAVQEYREGVRVLQESKADQQSPSMALFRWYLGKALLDTGEVKPRTKRIIVIGLGEWEVCWPVKVSGA